MAIRLRCPQCRCRLECPEKLVGQIVACPKCGVECHIPPPAGQRPLPPSSPSPENPARPTPFPEASRGTPTAAGSAAGAEEIAKPVIRPGPAQRSTANRAGGKDTIQRPTPVAPAAGGAAVPAGRLFLIDDEPPVRGWARFTATVVGTLALVLASLVGYQVYQRAQRGTPEEVEAAALTQGAGNNSNSSSTNGAGASNAVDPVANAARQPVDALPVASLIQPGAGVDALAAEAHGVLKTHCYRCHGEDGTAEGGFNFVLHRDRLVAGGSYVKPGAPDDSFLLARMTSGEMPPDGSDPRPNAAELEIVRRWIAGGAADFHAPVQRNFVADADVARLIRRDLESVVSRDRRYARYFTLTNLYNSGFAEEELSTYRMALSKLLNSLSWNRTLTSPVPIDPAKTVFRIDLRDLNWNDDVWAEIVKANPYAVVSESFDAKEASQLCDCQLPHVRADWFVFAASQPPLYHTVLQLPATLSELEKLLKIDLAQDISRERVYRVGMKSSGVSQNNRMLERHESPYGAFWISYDFAGNTGRKNLDSHPLGPGSGEDRFDHDGGEIIFNLPNGLQAYLLVDAKGNRLDKAPLSIVSDPKRPDRAVVNGVSCMACHYAGIIVKNDEIRRHVERSRASFPEADDILALYPPKNIMDQLFTDDAARFRTAVEHLGLKEQTSTGEPVVAMALRFGADMDLKAASAELGLQAQDLIDRLQRAPQLNRVLGAVTVPGGSIKRETFITEFGRAIAEFGLGRAINANAATQVADNGNSPATTTPASNTTANSNTPTATAPNPIPTTPNATAPGNTTTVATQPTGTSPPAANPPATTPAAQRPLPVDAALLSAAISVRRWTDRAGNAIDATFVAQAGNMVRLKRTDGVEVQVAVEILSITDQELIKQLVANPAATPSDLPDGDQPATSTIAGTPGAGDPAAGPPGPMPPKTGPPARPLNLRVWTGVVDQTTLEAEFLSLRDGVVRLKRANGIVVPARLDWLSPADQRYIRDQVGEVYFTTHGQLPPGDNTPPPPRDP